jgi:hypothetical protein
MIAGDLRDDPIVAVGPMGARPDTAYEEHQRGDYSFSGPLYSKL